MQLYIVIVKGAHYVYTQGGGSGLNRSTQHVQILVWKGGFKTVKMCGFVWTQKGGKISLLQ